MRGAAAVCAKTRRTGSRRWEAAAHYNGNKNNVVHSWRVRLFTATTTTTRHFHKQTLFARFAFACLDSSAWPRLQPQQQQQHSSISISSCFSCSFSFGSGYGSGFYLRISVIIINTTSQPSSQAARQPSCPRAQYPCRRRRSPSPLPTFSLSCYVHLSQLPRSALHQTHFPFSFSFWPRERGMPSQARPESTAWQAKARQGKARLTVESSHTSRRIESSRVLAASLFQHAARCLSI